MKKIILVGAVALFGLSNAQEGFNIGVHVGLPFGGNTGIVNNETTSSVAAGLDVAYRFHIVDKLSLGPATGYQAFIGKEVEYGGDKYKYSTTSVIPIVASAVYKFSDQFAVGLDLGYGIAFGGKLTSINGESVNDSDFDNWDYDDWDYGDYYDVAYASANSYLGKAKGGVLWAPKAYYYFGNSSVWAGFQGLSMVGSTGSFNVGFSYSLK